MIYIYIYIYIDGYGPTRSCDTRACREGARGPDARTPRALANIIPGAPIVVPPPPADRATVDAALVDK